MGFLNLAAFFGLAAAVPVVLHDPDLAEAILDRVLERGRVIHLRGPSYRTPHLGPKQGPQML